MRVCVTGSEGYIGSVLVPRLRSRGHQVLRIDVGYFADRNSPLFGTDSTGDYLAVDVREVGPEHLEAVDAVIHLAGLSNDPLGNLSPDVTFDINVRGTQAVATAARGAGVSHFVFASSCSIYGEGLDDRELAEDDEPRPITPYAQSKVMSEELLQGLATREFRTTSLRAATVFGFSPNLRLDLVINELTARAVAGLPVELTSAGTSWRPFIHIDDLCDAYAEVIEAGPRPLAHHAYNVGSAESTFRIVDAAERICAVTGAHLKLNHHAPVDDRNYRVGFDRFRRELPQWSAQWSLERGVQSLATELEAAGFTADDLMDDRFWRLARLRRELDAGRLDDTLRVVDADDQPS